MSPKEVKKVKPGDKVKVGGFEIRAIPAYNTNKYKEPGKHFHPKQDGKVGYIVKTKSGVTIYHTGDSDVIPEMDNLAPDIALLPVSGTYVMTADEAVQAVSQNQAEGRDTNALWRQSSGHVADAEKFKSKQNAKFRYW